MAQQQRPSKIPRISPTLIFLSAFSAFPSAAQQATKGPLAQVSIGGEDVYSLARPCAANCLSYRGDWPCQVRGFYDLGAELGCGRCARINNCYCNTEYGSSATDYIRRCVPFTCGANVVNTEAEIASILAIYDGYCRTAMVAPAAVTTTKATGESEPNPLKTDGPEPGSSPDNEGEATKTGEAETTQTKSTSEAKSENSKDKDEGLSRSDIVALAASLGVGIPSLLVATITLYVQMKRRRKAKRESVAFNMQPVPKGFQQPTYGYGQSDSRTGFIR